GRKVNSVIFCCDRASVMLARRGLPSFEKNSSDSSSESINPSNWKEPQINRTAGGTNLSPSCTGVMKYAPFCVSLRTSVSCVCPSGNGAVTSNHSCKESLVVPAPTNCRAGAPRWSPAPEGVCSWLAKLTLRVSGLNCTLTLRSALISLRNSASSWRSSAFSSFIASGIGSPARVSFVWLFQRQRLIGELQFFNGDRAIFSIQGRRFQFDRKAPCEHETRAYGLPIGS